MTECASSFGRLMLHARMVLGKPRPGATLGAPRTESPVPCGERKPAAPGRAPCRWPPPEQGPTHDEEARLLDRVRPALAVFRRVRRVQLFEGVPDRLARPAHGPRGGAALRARARQREP